MALARQAAVPAAIARHYLHLGERQRRTYFADAHAIPLKKIFYALRPAVALRWLRLNHDKAVPPMHFPTLVAASDLPAHVVAIIDDLLARKAVTRELGDGSLPEPIGALIDAEFAIAREHWARQPWHADPVMVAAANALFRRWVDCPRHLDALEPRPGSIRTFAGEQSNDRPCRFSGFRLRTLEGVLQKALAPLGYTLIMEVTAARPKAAARRRVSGRQGKPDFWIGGEGGLKGILHIAIAAENRATVDAFHRAALAAGGKDNGAPGLRPHYHPNYYGAFVLDPDGHNIEAVCHGPA